MFAPVEDRDEQGRSFTHRSGDVVLIATLMLGAFVNWMAPTDVIEG